MNAPRPPSIIINDDDSVRSDLNSDCIRKTYVNLPVTDSWKTYDQSWNTHSQYVKERADYMRQNDMKAYNLIKHKFPKFTPPNI